MAIKKVYELSVDLKKTTTRVNVPVLVQGDSAEFRIRLLDDGNPLSTEQLTGITAVRMQSGYDAQTVIQTVGTLQGSVAVFRLKKNELFRSGTVQAMVQLEDSADRISTLRFQYQVIPDLSGNYIPGEQDLTIFQRYMNEAQAKIDEMAATDVAQLTVKLAETDGNATNARNKTNAWVDVKEDFGAIGDGLTHPLSEIFPTIEVARMKYPHAVSLTDEIDWAAIQGAINSIESGEVKIPKGTYHINLPIIRKEFVDVIGYSWRNTILIHGDHAAFKKSDNTDRPFMFSKIANMEIRAKEDKKGIGIDLFNSSYSVIEHVFIKGSQTGINYQGHCYYNEVISPRISNCYKGISFKGASNGNYFSNIRLINNVNAITDGVDNTVTHDPIGNFINGLFIEQIDVYEGPAEWGIDCTRMRNLTISGGRIEIHHGNGIRWGAATTDNKIENLIVAVYSDGGVDYQDNGIRNSRVNVFNFISKRNYPDLINSNTVQGASFFTKLGQQRPSPRTGGELWQDNTHRSLGYSSPFRTYYMPISGAISATSGESSAVVEFATSHGSQPDTTYYVTPSAEWDTGGMWVTNKGGSSFTINTKNPAPAGHRILHWTITRNTSNG